jgi:hypothetical protein
MPSPKGNTLQPIGEQACRCPFTVRDRHFKRKSRTPASPPIPDNTGAAQHFGPTGRPPLSRSMTILRAVREGVAAAICVVGQKTSM